MTNLAGFLDGSVEHGNIAVVLTLLETVCPRVLLQKLSSRSLDTEVGNQHALVHLLHRDGTSDQIFIFESLPFLIVFDVFSIFCRFFSLALKVALYGLLFVGSATCEGDWLSHEVTCYWTQEEIRDVHVLRFDSIFCLVDSLNVFHQLLSVFWSVLERDFLRDHQLL